MFSSTIFGLFCALDDGLSETIAYIVSSSHHIGISRYLCSEQGVWSRHNMPHPSPPSVGAKAPRAAEPTAPDRNVAVGSHGEYVPTHRCSCLIRKRRDE